MNPSSVQFIKTQNIVVSGTPQKINDGQKVHVKVLENKGGGNYVVSFFGNKFSVKSPLSLVPGQKFSGVIKAFQNGQIQIVPDSNMTVLEGSGESFSGFLSMNGLEGNALFSGLISFFQQSGLNIDMKLMDKAMRIASRFPGKEKAAGEIAALFLSRGIEPSDKEILELLGLLGKDESGSSSQGEEKKEEASCCNEFSGGKQEAVSVLLDRLYGEGSGKILGLEGGALTLLNQTRTGDKHWLFLPYEAQFGKKSGRGIIRLLINLYSKNLEKVSVNYDTQYTSYFFVLYYEGSKVKEIRFCTLPPLLTPNISKEEERLGELFRSGMNESGSVPVTYSSSAFIDGFCSSSEDILVADIKA